MENNNSFDNLILIDSLYSTLSDKYKDILQFRKDLVWFPNWALVNLQDLLAAIIKHKEVFYDKIRSISSDIHKHNFLFTEVEFLKAELDFINETSEDIALTQIFFNNLCAQGFELFEAANKSCNFFIDKNKFTEDRTNERLKKITSRFVF